MGDIPDIADVLLQQRLVEPELLVVLGHHRVDVVLDVATRRRLLHQLVTDRVAARESGQNEVDRRRDPDDDKEEGDSAEEIVEAHDWNSEVRSQKSETSNLEHRDEVGRFDTRRMSSDV